MLSIYSQTNLLSKGLNKRGKVDDQDIRGEKDTQ
jgi:hypothetical protein